MLNILQLQNSPEQLIILHSDTHYKVKVVSRTEDDLFPCFEQAEFFPEVLLNISDLRHAEQAMTDINS